jgi:hypothetical protein
MAIVRSAAVTSFLIAALIVGAAGDVHAKITIRRHVPSDSFFFHGNYSSVPFTPSDGFALQLWNCAGGQVPEFIAGPTPFVACGYDPKTGYALADLVYQVALPGGVCKDHGRSCYYRDATVPRERDGVRYFRVRYARQGHGNRVWLESYGDLSAAIQANMLIVIRVNGGPRAVLQDTFTPLPDGGWFSPF